MTIKVQNNSIPEMNYHWFVHIGSLEESFIEDLKKIMEQNRIIERIWSRDYTVWKPAPKEIIDRLAWLDLPNTMNKSEITDHLLSFAKSIKKEGYTNALLLGMGGSSLAPEVFSKIFHTKSGFLKLGIVDSTDPEMIRNVQKSVNLKKTLFIVSSKSGSTVETLSAFKFFYKQIVQIVGKNEAGKHFVAVTDPESGLAKMAQIYGFRETFLNEPNVGGRFSALSYVGIMPAVLIGMDLKLLFEKALQAMKESSPPCDLKNILHYTLGVLIGSMALNGRDKLTIILSPKIESFGDWLEQLIAESLGKEGKGVLPVVNELLDSIDEVGLNRFFIYIKLNTDNTYNTLIGRLMERGYPLVQIELNDIYDLGGQIFIWEMATAIAGYILKINPFDQPNVESAKALAKHTLDDYKNAGSLKYPVPIYSSPSLDIFGINKVSSIREALEWLLKQAQNGSYICIQAYVCPNKTINVNLEEMRKILRKKTKLAVTVGYGPRYLHSTGQLHKGDSGKGLFIQMVAKPPVNDLPIPDEITSDTSSATFGILENAQALGDRSALLDAKRNVLTFLLKSSTEKCIKEILQAITT